MREQDLQVMATPLTAGHHFFLDYSVFFLGEDKWVDPLTELLLAWIELYPLLLVLVFQILFGCEI